jgi:hypothetical protein
MKNNEKITLDEQVRAALENFAEPYNAAHWQAMNERLDALDAADTAFDNSLRGRLANISVLPMADAWTKMADKLDDMDAAESSFDDALRGRLADVKVAPTMGDWSKMSAALDNFDDTETEFDDVLRRKLENIAAHRPNHWAMMNERLDREFTLKGKILRYKVIEVALMLFAFFTVLNVLDLNTEGSNFDANSQNVEVTSEKNQNTKQGVDKATLNGGKSQGFESNNSSNNTGNKATEFNAPTRTSETNTPQFITPQSNPQTPNNGVKTFDSSPNWRLRGGIQSPQNSGQALPQNSPSATQPQNFVPKGQPLVDNTGQNSLNDGQNMAGNDIPIRIGAEGVNVRNNGLQNTVFSTNESENAFNSAMKDVKTNQNVVTIVPEINTLQAGLLNNSKLDAPINITQANTDKKGRWRLAIFGTTALDWVKTSYVDGDRVQHFQKQRVPNVGINALVGYKRGKVELETGIMVNRKKYSIENVEVRKYAAFRGVTTIEKPKDLRLSIVSIPLNAHVQLKNTRRWNIYAHSGVAANAIVDALDRREDTKPPNSSNSGAPVPQNDPILASYSKGLLNGGETKENVYFTGQVGVGIEYKLTPSTNLFLQPTAAFMLSKKRGIGTLDDRLQTYSIQGGAKWRL